MIRDKAQNNHPDGRTYEDTHSEVSDRRPLRITVETQSQPGAGESSVQEDDDDGALGRHHEGEKRHGQEREAESYGPL
jgi:hypothetical protein